MTKSLFTKISLLACTFFAALPLSFGANNEYIDEKVENLGKLPCTGIELGKITGEYVKLPLITEKLISDAKSGDLEAQKKLFPYCISKEEQIYWLRRSAENGDASSQFGLHFRYKNGADNFPVSQEKSIFWAYKAALNDQINAQVDLAEYYYNKNDIEKAIKWYKRVANETRTSGSMAYPKAVATYTLGEIYLKNTDYDTAILYFTQCINHLNKISLPSKDEFFKTRIPPQEYIEKINGLRKNQTLNQKPQDSRTATDELLESLIKRANDNDAEAQFQLSRAYINATHGAHKDLVEAEIWAQKAIKNGNLKAHNSLGFIRSLNKDKSCIEHYEIAAEAGLDMAQHNLSNYYTTGKYVAQDNIKAFEWCKKASEQGLGAAQQKLAFCYFLGIGCAKNYDLAEIWAEKAIKNGMPRAHEILDAIGTIKNTKNNQNDPQTFFTAGQIYESTKDVKADIQETLIWFVEGARRGNKDCRSKIKSLAHSDTILADFLFNYRGANPVNNGIYHHEIHGGPRQVMLQAFQVVKDGVLIKGIDMFPAMADYSSTPDKIIFVKTSRQYADLDFLDAGYYIYDGTYSYVTVNGSTKRIHAFKECYTYNTNVHFPHNEELISKTALGNMMCSYFGHPIVGESYRYELGYNITLKIAQTLSEGVLVYGEYQGWPDPNFKCDRLILIKTKSQYVDDDLLKPGNYRCLGIEQYTTVRRANKAVYLFEEQ